MLLILGTPVTSSSSGLAEERLPIKKRCSDLRFEFTTDPRLLGQYREMYERECRVAFHIPGFREAETMHDRKAHILIVRHGDQCVGGGRFSVRTPEQLDPLPLELDGFRLEDHFPELASGQLSYGEFSRLVLLPEFRGGDITLEMWRHFHRKCVALNVAMVYAAAPLANLRAYRKNTLAIGLKDTVIHRGIEIPPYPSREYVKDYLLSIVIEALPGMSSGSGATNDNQSVSCLAD